MSSSSSSQQRVLALGDACLTCRAGKKKCDGTRPACTRCLRLGKSCTYADGIQRRRRTDILESKLNELQTRLLDLSGAHDRVLVSTRLFEKINLLAVPAPIRVGLSEVVPMFPLEFPAPFLDFPGGEVSEEDMEESYRPVTRRSSIKEAFASWDRAGDVSPMLSLYLIQMFLPFRSQFHFCMDIRAFLEALALAPSDPRALHPSLLNAIYLAACSMSSGCLATYEPIFLERTRFHLQEQLTFADRLTHFLWANVLLGSYLGRAARLVEAYATITATSRFAIACGLPGIELSSEQGNIVPLLPPPNSRTETEERTRLCHAIYMLDRCFVMCTGWQKSFPMISLSPGDISNRSSQLPLFSNGVSDIENPTSWDFSDIRINIRAKAMVLYERVEIFVTSMQGRGVTDATRKEYTNLANDLEMLSSELPPITDSEGIHPLEACSKTNPHLIPAHTSIFGAELVLYSLEAATDVSASRKVIKAAHSLAMLCRQMRGTTGLSTIHIFIQSIGHMLYAAQIFARQLKLADTRRDTPHLAACCSALADLIDFLYDMASVAPRWAHILVTLRDLLPQSPAVIETL